MLVAFAVAGMALLDTSPVELRGTHAIALPAAAAIVRSDRVVLDVDASTGTQIDVSFPTRDGRAAWAADARVVRGGRGPIELPLRYFRWSRGAVPAWEDVASIEITASGGTATVHAITLEPGDRPDAAYRSVAEIERLAFGDVTLTRLKRFERRPFVVLTDAPELDTAGLLDALDGLYRLVRRELPSLRQPNRPVVLIVFRDQSAYRAFWPRFFAPLDLRIAQGVEIGMTGMGVGATWYAGPSVTDWPTYVHEASHALVAQMLGLASEGCGWFEEGLARHHDLVIASGDPAARVRGEMAVTGPVPLVDLLAPGRLPGGWYVHAATFLEWLMDDPLRRSQVPGALVAMRATGCRDVPGVLRAKFGLSIAAAETAWRGWLESTYGTSLP